MKVISTDKAPAAIGPYSQAIVTGDMVYTSGQIPLVPSTGEMVSGGIEVQARQALENLKAVLEAAGSGLTHVVKTTVFVKDLNDFSAINQVYAEFFRAPFPARSLVEVARLPRDAGIEIEAVAILK